MARSITTGSSRSVSGCRFARPATERSSRSCGPSSAWNRWPNCAECSPSHWRTRWKTVSTWPVTRSGSSLFTGASLPDGSLVFASEVRPLMRLAPGTPGRRRSSRPVPALRGDGRGSKPVPGDHRRPAQQRRRRATGPPCRSAARPARRSGRGPGSGRPTWARRWRSRLICTWAPTFRLRCCSPGAWIRRLSRRSAADSAGISTA